MVYSSTCSFHSKQRSGLSQTISQILKKDLAISKVASNKFAGHLWYICEELAPLDFFDTAVTANCKRAMVKALHERQGEDDPKKRLQLKVQESVTMVLEDFITTNSIAFFYRLGISADILHTDLETWEQRQDYMAGLEIMQQLKVVNDNVERGMALIEELN